MRMTQRRNLFIVVTILWWSGFLLAPTLEFGLIVAGLWVLAAAVASFKWLRCPHCEGLAGIRPNGFSTISVGRECHHCGHEY